MANLTEENLIPIASNINVKAGQRLIKLGDSYIPVGMGGNFTSDSGGGIDTSDASATASDIRDGKTAYVNGVMVEGTIQDKVAETYTPGTAAQTIPEGKYLAGDQTISGDANLVASNIKKDVAIFGVTGSYEGTGGSSTTKKAVYVFYLNNASTYRMLGADVPFGETVARLAPTTSVSANYTIVDGKLYKCLGISSGKSETAAVQIGTDADWQYVTGESGGGDRFALKGGAAYYIPESGSPVLISDAGITNLTDCVVLAYYLAPRRAIFLDSTGKVYGYNERNVNITGPESFGDSSVSGIASFLPITGGSNMDGNVWYAIDTAGNVVSLAMSEYDDGDGWYLYKSTFAAADGTPWTKFYPFYDDYGGMGGGFCNVGAKGHLLYYKNLSNNTITQISGTFGDASHPVQTIIGYVGVSASENYDEETGNFTYTGSPSNYCYVEDGFGKLWKLAGTIDSTSGNITGVTATQVGTETGWTLIRRGVPGSSGVNMLYRDGKLYLDTFNTSGDTITEMSFCPGTLVDANHAYLVFEV